MQIHPCEHAGFATEDFVTRDFHRLSIGWCIQPSAQNGFLVGNSYDAVNQIRINHRVVYRKPTLKKAAAHRQRMTGYNPSKREMGAGNHFFFHHVDMCSQEKGHESNPHLEDHPT